VTSTTGSGAGRGEARGGPLGLGDAVQAEHPIVSPQVAPGREVGAVGADHDVLWLDLSDGLDAADVEVMDRSTWFSRTACQMLARFSASGVGNEAAPAAAPCRQ